MTTSPAASPQAETFKCPQCGAPRMDYDPATGGLKCPQCGHTQTLTAAAQAVEEHDLTAALSDAGKARGYGRAMKAIKCSSCGATTQVDPAVVSTACPFCGSAQVLEQSADPNILQPESVIPFQITSDQAYQNYKQWLGKGFFRPRDVLERSGATQMLGVYLPFWTFDAQANSTWTAESGDYYYVTEHYTTTENGKEVSRTRQVRKVRWYPSAGAHADFYDDVLVSGTTSGDQAMLKSLYPFDTARLVAYQPEYLSGWAAEAYRIPLADAWKSGQEIIHAEEYKKCDGQVPGDTHRDLSVRTRYSETTYKHVLLPVFLSNYRYNGKLFHFMVNGQTGRVKGQAPVDWIKVLIVVLIVLLIVGLVAFVVYQLDQGSHNTQSLVWPALRTLAAMLPAPPGDLWV